MFRFKLKNRFPFTKGTFSGSGFLGIYPNLSPSYGNSKSWKPRFHGSLEPAMLYPAVGSGKIRQHTDLDLGVLPWYTRCVAIEMRKSWKINENHHELNQPSNFGVLDFQALSRWDPLFLGSHNLCTKPPKYPKIIFGAEESTGDT